MSDLSGSYYNGGTGGGGGGHSSRANTTTAPVLTIVPTSGCWRHAKVLSSHRLPQHPQPPADDESSVGVRGVRRQLQQQQTTTSVMNGNSQVEAIEVCVQDTSNNTPNNLVAGLPAAEDEKNSNRTPLLLLLMDPSRKMYELLQMWMDASQDTVRDVLQTVNRNLDNSNHWKQDYDGLFQVRNNHFSQLIHVLVAGKYEVVPGEVWVCKPWSMSAKQTVTHASTCLNHLKEIGILQYRRVSDFAPVWKQWMRNKSADDTVLVLSKTASQRVYVPEGILKHHHACQFLSFVPPLEEEENVHLKRGVMVDVLSGDGDDANSTASGLSDSNCGSEIPTAVNTSNNDDQLVLLEDDAVDLDGKLYPSTKVDGGTDVQQEMPQEPNLTETTTFSATPSSHNTSVRDAASTVSAVTKESAFVLRTPGNGTHIVPYVLPSSHKRDPSSQPPSSCSSGLVRWLSALNCSSKQNAPAVGVDGEHSYPHHSLKHHYQSNHNYDQQTNNWRQRSNGTARTVSDSTTTYYSRERISSGSGGAGWDVDEDAASQSSGAPLLFAAAQTVDWVSEL